MLVIQGFEAAAGASIDVDHLLPMLWPQQADATPDTRLIGNGIAKAAASAGPGDSDIKVPVHCGMRAMSARMGMG